MKLAIMQPYFFPYLGYFQLLNAVDKFLFLDDAAYNRRGWMHRNRILEKGIDQFVSLPVKKAPLGTPIQQIELGDNVEASIQAIRQRIRIAYRKSDYLDEGLRLFDMATHDAESLALVAQRSVEATAKALGVKTPTGTTSRADPAMTSSGAERLIALCQQQRATTYVNAPGGRDLYSPERFEAEGIKLRFLAPTLQPYPQQASEFVPGLSVLDAIMNVGPDRAGEMARMGSCEP